MCRNNSFIEKLRSELLANMEDMTPVVQTKKKHGSRVNAYLRVLFGSLLLVGLLLYLYIPDSERESETYAIVIDAGSSKTRSTLFRIKLKKPLEYFGTPSQLNRFNFTSPFPINLADIMLIKEVETCTNGEPLTYLKSKDDASRLLKSCLLRLMKTVKKAMGPEVDYSEEIDSGALTVPVAIMNRKKNNQTRVILGATAGIRILQELHPEMAREKIEWVGTSISEFKNLIKGGPELMKGSVSILTGADEAAYAWVAVNFVGDKLELKRSADQTAGLELEGTASSIGIVEMGGASTQIAYQVDDSMNAAKVSKIKLEPKDVDFFNKKYHLAVRSDSCLGADQVTDRSSWMTLNNYFDTLSPTERAKPGSIKVLDPCGHIGYLKNISKTMLSNMLTTPCLISSKSDDALRNYLASRETIQLVGLGDYQRCDALLTHLVDQQLCRQRFKLCPNDKTLAPPPKDMPFVPICVINYAFQPLNLNKLDVSSNNPKYAKLEKTIASKLGGYSVSHREVVERVKDFCTTPLSDLKDKYRKLDFRYIDALCLRTIYIIKMLTELYLFDTEERWNQIKFTIFPPSAVNPEDNQSRDDIGWSLGVLLNSTNADYASQSGLFNRA